jgi:hypothetical protein
LFDFKGEPCPGACYVEQNVLHSHVGGALGHLMAFSGAISASFWSDQHGNAPYGASDRFVQSQNAAEATAGFWLGRMISGRLVTPSFSSIHLPADDIALAIGKAARRLGFGIDMVAHFARLLVDGI